MSRARRAMADSMAARRASISGRVTQAVRVSAVAPCMWATSRKVMSGEPRSQRMAGTADSGGEKGAAVMRET